MELRDLADVRRIAEQELRPGVGRAARIDRGAAFQRRQRAVEAERAARRAERSALRLEVVQRVLVVFEAEAQAVRSLDLAQVDGGGVLVVAELEGAAGAGVADVGDARDLEARECPCSSSPTPLVPGMCSTSVPKTPSCGSPLAPMFWRV